ncbi:hypothetical protein [Massilia glaciei]|nr:hypothetical protein [Massilia glaciei]
MKNTNAQTPAPDADPGFKLPGEDAPAKPAEPVDGINTIEVAPVAEAPVADTSSRDLAVGAVVFVILLVVYFFVRNAYVHHLVVRRVPPSNAGSAGSLMFVGLCFMSAAAVLAMINAGKFLTFAITAPLVAVGLIALVAALFVGRR